MSRILSDFRSVYVIGVGLHRYQRLSETPYVVLGLTAIREALQDASIDWSSVNSAYVASALLGMAPSRAMLKHLGATGIPITRVENASASGSTAFRSACMDVAAGFSDVSLAVGVDKPGKIELAPGRTGIQGLESGRVVPFTHFALLAKRYMEETGTSSEQLAQVVVKNSRNGALNPYAQRQKARTVKEVLSEPPISGALTRLQCCPIGEGGAAVLIASEDAILKLGIKEERAVRIRSSVLRSETLYESATSFDACLTTETTEQALKEASITASQLDLVELHDAFSVEELLYLEAMGICPQGEAAARLDEGAFDIGGDCAVSTSGGLLAMGHPIGPTGIGQIAEISKQLRGEAGPRQHTKPKLGLAHMVGVGAVCAVHVLGID